jgi:hypothetical protein
VIGNTRSVTINVIAESVGVAVSQHADTRTHVLKKNNGVLKKNNGVLKKNNARKQ